MILVNYTRLNRRLSAALIGSFLHRLPPHKADALARLGDSKQATASVLGLILLGQAAEQLNVVDFSYKKINFSPTQKPTCSNGIEFNITHSENIVACAVSLSTALGIDSETTDERNPRLLHHVFNDNELAQIKSGARSSLELWVKKEAVAKATGSGVLAMKAIVLDQERASCNNQSWYLQRLALDVNDVSYLACQEKNPDISLQEHSFSDCVDYYSSAHVQDQQYG
jgi:4'-phosphopantetheinyl transferase